MYNLLSSSYNSVYLLSYYSVFIVSYNLITKHQQLRLFYISLSTYCIIIYAYDIFLLVIDIEVNSSTWNLRLSNIH